MTVHEEKDYEIVELEHPATNTSQELEQADDIKDERVWDNLTAEEKQAVIALTLSSSVRKAAEEWSIRTGKAKSTFFNKVYPSIKFRWREFASEAQGEAMNILKVGSIKAAKKAVELIDFPHPDVQLKAANSVLKHVMPKQESGGTNIGIQQNFIKMQADADKFIK